VELLPARLAKALLFSLLVFLLAATLTLPIAAEAVSNPLDPTFGRDGVVVTPDRNVAGNGSIFSLTLSGEKLMAVGGSPSGPVLLRYRGNGELDPSLRGDRKEEQNPSYPGGVVTPELEAGEGEASDVMVQRNGDILVVGLDHVGVGQGAFASVVVARFHATGRIDPSFGKRGSVKTHLGDNYGGADALALQPNGKILVGGFRETLQRRTEGLVVRYLPSGSLDASFGTRGIVRFKIRHRGQANVHDLAVLPSGKILAVGGFKDRFFLARLQPDGKPDRSFGGGDGRVLTDVDGRSYCAFAICAHANSVALSHGRILLAGVATDSHAEFSVVARYRFNGRLDRGFGDHGLARARRQNHVLTAEKMVLQRNGRIVLAGRYEHQVAVQRFLPDGRPDPSFGHAGCFTRQIGYESAAYAAVVQRDGKVVVGGYAKPNPEPFVEVETPYTNAHFMLMRFR
jgi:uncharacterized delta-60 repeat protein